MSCRMAVRGLLNHALLHCNIGSCTLKPIAWVALRFPNEGWRRMENPGWEHYLFIFKFPGEVQKLELALGPFVFVFPFPPLFPFGLINFGDCLHNFIRLGLMNHSSSVRDCRPGRVCVSVTKTRKNPHQTHQERGSGGREKETVGQQHSWTAFWCLVSDN